jgi:sugar phosphate isomerase/epimerase
MDMSPDRRKRLVDLAGSLGIEFAALGACTNFTMTDHILAQRQDKELLFVRECCKLAQDLNCKIVRTFAAWIGYFMPEHWQQGYSNTAMHSRSLDVSTEDDYLRQWNHARSGIREAGEIAADHGITLAVQNHPPLTNCLQDCIEMVEEVGLPNVKMSLDLPLFECQDDEYVSQSVHRVGDRMIHSHILGITFKTSLVGGYGFDELVPGQGRENWPAFLKACKGIGYAGYLSYEQCSPIIVKGHKKATIDEVDRRFRAGLEYLIPLMTQIGVYSGKAVGQTV